MHAFNVRRRLGLRETACHAELLFVVYLFARYVKNQETSGGRRGDLVLIRHARFNVRRCLDLREKGCHAEVVSFLPQTHVDGLP